jgi:hypothetical protein
VSIGDRRVAMAAGGARKARERPVERAGVGEHHASISEIV